MNKLYLLSIYFFITSQAYSQYFECSYLSDYDSVMTAKNWNCKIKIEGHWMEPGKNASCHSPGNDKDSFEPGVDKGDDTINIRGTDFETCQAKYEKMQKLQLKHNSCNGDLEHDEYHLVRTKIKDRSRNPKPRYYYRALSVSSIQCYFYQYRYQYYQF